MVSMHPHEVQGCPRTSTEHSPTLRSHRIIVKSMTLLDCVIVPQGKAESYASALLLRFNCVDMFRLPAHAVNAPAKERLAEAARFKAVTEAYEVLSDGECSVAQCRSIRFQDLSMVAHGSCYGVEGIPSLHTCWIGDEKDRKGRGYMAFPAHKRATT
eukprot:1158448-Pelagomonas_calceolata.AAC.7